MRLRVGAPALAALVALVLAASGCVERGGQPQDTLIFGTSGDPPVLDGAQSSDLESARVVGQVFETLVKLAPDGKGVVPGLAHSWQVSADGHSWTFWLQRGVKFHDGTDLNADAVCTNFERWYRFRGVQQSLSLTVGWRSIFGGFATQDDPTAPKESLYRWCEPRSEDEVAIHLTRPSARFLPGVAVWTFSIASPDALRRYEADRVVDTPTGPRFEGTFGTEHPIGTGPFKFERWERGERIVLVRNDGYWGERARLRRVILRPILDASARRQALEAGEVHGYDPVDPADIEPLISAGFRVLRRLPMNVVFMGFNQTMPPLGNLKIRQAVAHAVNREALIRAKYPAGTEMAKTFMPPGVAGYAEDVMIYPYDPDRARRLIAESGVANPSVELWYPTAFTDATLPDPEGIFQAVRADLERVGFTVVPKSAPWQPEYFSSVLGGKAQMYFMALYGEPDADAYLGTFFRERAAPWGFEDPQLFAMVNEARDEVDPTRRSRLYEEINRRVMRLLPGLPLVHVRPAVALAAVVAGFEAHPLGPPDDFSKVSLQ